MVLPAGIPTVPCTVGAGFGIEGAEDLGATITVVSSVRGLVWAATGDAAVRDAHVVTVTPGATATLNLIPTNLDGWLLNGAAVDVSGGKQSHVYRVTVQWTKPPTGGSTKPSKVGDAFVYENVVIPQDTVGSLDIDRMVSTQVSGIPVTLPPDFTGGKVKSVNGGVGDVVLTAASVGADTAGAAAAAQAAAEAYTDAHLAGLGTAATHAATDFDPAGAAQAEQTRALAAEALLAPRADAHLTGTPTAPTAAPGTNTLQLANTAFVAAAVSALVNAAPGALDTLKELADAIGDDANFAATVTNALAGKQPLDSDLTAIAALTTTAFGRGLLALADAAALRSAAALGTLATQNGTFSGTSSGTNTGDQDLSGLALKLVPTATKTAAYTAAVNDLVLTDATSGAFAVTLTSAPADKSVIEVKKLDSSANAVTITCGGTDTFAVGGTTLALVFQGHAARMQYQASGGKWITLDNDVPLTQLDGRYLRAQQTVGFVAPPKTMLTNKLMHVPISSGPLSQSNQASTQAAMWLSPLPVTEACTLSQVAAAISGTAGSAGAVFRIGVYPFTPGASPLYDSGALSATALGTVAASLSLALTPGLYLVAFVSQGSPATAPNFRVGLPASGWNPVLAYDSASYFTSDSPVWAYQMAGVTGALPALGTLTTVTSTANYMPIVGLTF